MELQQEAIEYTNQNADTSFTPNTLVNSIPRVVLPFDIQSLPMQQNVFLPSPLKRTFDQESFHTSMPWKRHMPYPAPSMTLSTLYHPPILHTVSPTTFFDYQATETKIPYRIPAPIEQPVKKIHRHSIATSTPDPHKVKLLM